MWRVVLGFVICSTTYPWVVLSFPNPGAAAGASLVALFTISGALVVGVPLFVWFKKRGWLKCWQSLLGGAVAGVVVSLPFLVSGWLGYLYYAGIFSGIGAFHALVFWVIAVYRNRALLSTARSSAMAETANSHAT